MIVHLQQLKGCKVPNKVCERGAICQWKIYERGTVFEKKNGMWRGKGLNLRPEPPHINTCWVPSPAPPPRDKRAIRTKKALLFHKYPDSSGRSLIYYINTDEIPGFFRLLKIISSSRAVEILFLSFKCEGIGVAMVTNMISQLLSLFLLYNFISEFHNIFVTGILR